MHMAVSSRHLQITCVKLCHRTLCEAVLQDTTAHTASACWHVDQIISNGSYSNFAGGRAFRLPDYALAKHHLLLILLGMSSVGNCVLYEQCM